MNLSHLRCEYAEHPLGIDVPRPRFSWRLQSDRPGARQTAYQILATRNGETLWDSGKVESEQSHLVEYAGPPLRSGQRVTWQVRVWDEDGQPTDWSETAWFEMGLLDPADWRAGLSHTQASAMLTCAFSLTLTLSRWERERSAAGKFHCPRPRNPSSCSPLLMGEGTECNRKISLSATSKSVILLPSPDGRGNGARQANFVVQELEIRHPAPLS